MDGFDTRLIPGSFSCGIAYTSEISENIAYISVIVSSSSPTYIQPIADRVAQHLEIISINFQYSTRRTRILMGFVIYSLVLIVNPMDRILVRWKSFRNNLEMLCHPMCNVLYFIFTEESNISILTDIYTIFSQKSPILASSPTYIFTEKSYIGWRRPLGCHIITGHSPQKSPIISGSLAGKRPAT